MQFQTFRLFRLWLRHRRLFNYQHPMRVAWRKIKHEDPIRPPTFVILMISMIGIPFGILIRESAQIKAMTPNDYVFSALAGIVASYILVFMIVLLLPDFFTQELCAAAEELHLPTPQILTDALQLSPTEILVIALTTPSGAQAATLAAKNRLQELATIIIGAENKDGVGSTEYVAARSKFAKSFRRFRCLGLIPNISTKRGGWKPYFPSKS